MRRVLPILLIVAALALSAGPAFAGLCGTASFYGRESLGRTATGDYFDGTTLTAAMPDAAHLGERWLVTLAGRAVTVLINDIGPQRHLHRIIDLSAAAARQIGLTRRMGLATVCLRRLS